MINGTSARPWGDSALPHGKFPIGHYKVLVEIHPGAEAVAIGAGAIGAVEGEISRSQFRQADIAFRTRILLAKENLIASCNIDTHKPVGEVSGNLQRIPEAPSDALLNK